jgi:hypothetical protein
MIGFSRACSTVRKNEDRPIEPEKIEILKEAALRSPSSRNTKLRGSSSSTTAEDELKIEELKKLSKAERLQAMEALWNAMLHENGDMETPEWHEDILSQRKKIIENGSASVISLSDLKASRGR